MIRKYELMLLYDVSSGKARHETTIRFNLKKCVFFRQYKKALDLFCGSVLACPSHKAFVTFCVSTVVHMSLGRQADGSNVISDYI